MEKGCAEGEGADIIINTKGRWTTGAGAETGGRGQAPLTLLQLHVKPPNLIANIAY